MAGLIGCGWAGFLQPIPRDARLRRAPQDEAVTSGAKLNPDGEEARKAPSTDEASLRRENHEAPMTFNEAACGWQARLTRSPHLKAEATIRPTTAIVSEYFSV